MKGRRVSLSDAELAFIEARKSLTRRAMHAEFVRTFGRDDVPLTTLAGLCKRRGWTSGRTGRFEKGTVPHNAGKRRPDHWKKTGFKKGNVPHTAKYAGYERVSKDGYVEISVEQTNPHTGFERRFVLKHRWLWEQVHGPVPKGMALKCKGDKLNTDPSNWELVPRAILPRLNGGRNKKHVPYDSAPQELKPAILAVARIEHQVRQKREKAA